MERIWSWVYSEELGTLSEEVRPPSPLFLSLTSQTLADLRSHLAADSTLSY
jgi:hypothetical protein